jgi:hypothetical protein
MHGWVLSMAIAAAPLAPPGADTVTDARRGFSFRVPQGYRDFPAGRSGPKVLHAFATGEPSAEGTRLLRVEALGGVIGRGELDRPVVEQAARDSVKGLSVEVRGFEYAKLRWKSFDCDLVVTRLGAGGREVVTLGAQVPLAPEAIQLYLAGPAADEAELRATLQTLLGSLEGRSNWLDAGERAERLGRGMGTAVAVLIGLTALVIWWRKRGRAR